HADLWPLAGGAPGRDAEQPGRVRGPPDPAGGGRRAAPGGLLWVRGALLRQRLGRAFRPGKCGRRRPPGDRVALGAAAGASERGGRPAPPGVRAGVRPQGTTTPTREGRGVAPRPSLVTACGSTSC